MTINCAGLWLPIKVLLCPEMRGHETLLFGQIAALSANPRGCYASLDYFVELLKIAKPTVSEYIKGLQDKGLVEILRGRNEQGHPERQIFLTAKGAQLFIPDTPLATDPAAPSAVSSTAEDRPSEPSSAERTGQFGGANKPVRPSEPENKDINIIHARAREAGIQGSIDAEAFRRQVHEAAGEALADPAAYPEIAVMRDLTSLLVDLPTSPACLPGEIVDAARVMGVWYLRNRGPRSMTNYRYVRKKAAEYRDARIAGAPPPVPPPPKPSTAEDPAGYDRDKWRVIITRVAPKLGGWQAGWGPAPGESGTHVPEDLWPLWQESAA